MSLSLHSSAALRRSAVASLRATPVLRSSYVPIRHFNIFPNKRATTSMSNTPTRVPLHSTPQERSFEHLVVFNNKELLSFLIMGLCTLNKPILNTCIKLFPYTPIAIIRALVYRIYCGGETIEDVKKTGMRLHERGINNMMISLTIEACDGNDNVDPVYIVDETCRSVKEILVPHMEAMIAKSSDVNSIPSGYVALKPTGFAKDSARVLREFNTTGAAEFDELVEKAAKVCQTVYDSNIALQKKYPDRVAPFTVAVIDAEKHELQEGVYELQRRLYSKFNKQNQPISVVGTLQMYLSESSSLLAKEEQLAVKNNYRLGLKLVRGAYIHSEKNRATIIHQTKEDTDYNYNRGVAYCIESILHDKGNESTIGHLVVASHNAESLHLASSEVYNKFTEGSKNKSNIVLGQLLGMADTVTFDLIDRHQIGNVIKYVPWGPPLETKEYLRRRLEENGEAVTNDNGFKLVKSTVSELYRRMMGRS
ncbi:Proline dehydrogenase mitochondrial [Spathaspora sp. JA1]|nr:Proline dehydrogenase mitochondrial [Spathaspora sp. JA1]